MTTMDKLQIRNVLATPVGQSSVQFNESVSQLSLASSSRAGNAL